MSPVTPYCYNFCTYFDRNYFFKGLALYRSLLNTCADFKLWVLCLDDETFSLLAEMGYDNLNLVKLSELESYDRELLQVKYSRSIVEYYWTCTPILLSYILERERGVDTLTYLDADLFFFSDPSQIYSEFAGHSILIIPHRYSPEHAHMEAHAGIYNVGLLIFRQDENSYECLKWWRDKCVADCSLEGTCGDQRYLDDWPVRFSEVVVLQHKGAGLAPWNISQYYIQKKNSILIDSYDLIFYHFHSFRIISNDLFELCSDYTFSLKAILFIYFPYIHEIGNSMALVQRISPNFSSGLVKPSRKSYWGLLALLFRFRLIPAIIILTIERIKLIALKHKQT